MTETSFPFDAGAGSSVLEDGWGRMARLWARSGILVPEWAAGVGSLAAGAITGCKVALGAGLQVTVAVGEATVKGFYYANDASKPLTVAANASGNPRIDLAVLELDRVNNQILAKIVQGTPAASPVAPTLTQVYNGVWQHTLAQFTVVNAASVPSALVDLRTASSLPDGYDYCQVLKVAGQSFALTTTTKATWGNTTTGNANFWSSGNNQFVIPFAGWWYVEALVHIPNTASVSAIVVDIVKNAAAPPIARAYQGSQALSGFFTTNAQKKVLLAIGDIISCNVTSVSAAGIADAASTFMLKYEPNGI